MSAYLTLTCALWVAVEKMILVKINKMNEDLIKTVRLIGTAASSSFSSLPFSLLPPPPPRLVSEIEHRASCRWDKPSTTERCCFERAGWWIIEQQTRLSFLPLYTLSYTYTTIIYIHIWTNIHTQLFYMKQNRKKNVEKKSKDKNNRRTCGKAEDRPEAQWVLSVPDWVDEERWMPYSVCSITQEYCNAFLGHTYTCNLYSVKETGFIQGYGGWARESVWCASHWQTGSEKTMIQPPSYWEKTLQTEAYAQTQIYPQGQRRKNQLRENITQRSWVWQHSRRAKQQLKQKDKPE